MDIWNDHDLPNICFNFAHTSVRRPTGATSTPNYVVDSSSIDSRLSSSQSASVIQVYTHWHTRTSCHYLYCLAHDMVNCRMSPVVSRLQLHYWEEEKEREEEEKIQ